MSEALDALENTGPAKTPTFLKVLCILTFIGSGWGIISNLVFQDPLLSEYASYYYYVNILLCVGTLVGALQMWKLKKTGLYIWTAAEVISVILLWVVVKGFLADLMGAAEFDTGDASLNRLSSGMANEMVESTMNFMLMLYSIFPAAFVVMYWLNAKHLK